MREDGKNAEVQEDIAFPAMMKIGTSTPSGDTAVFIHTAASSHMVTAESRLCQHVVNTTSCSVYIKGSCGRSSATSKGTLVFRLRTEPGELVAIYLEVLIPNLGASMFSVGALHEKRVKLDLFSVPPVLRYGYHAFPISTEVPRMYVVHIVPDVQEIAQNADAWHRRMGHCHPRALKQLAEKPTTGVRFN